MPPSFRSRKSIWQSLASGPSTQTLQLSSSHHLYPTHSTFSNQSNRIYHNQLQHVPSYLLTLWCTTRFRTVSTHIFCSLHFPQLPPNIHIFQYADDTAFLALSKTIQNINKTLTEAIQIFLSWCSKWGLTINSSKTQAIVFIPPNCRSRIQRNPSHLNLKIQNETIQPSKTVTYLGLVIDHHLTWRPYLQKIVSKAKNRLNLLKRLTGTTWGLKPQTVINTYKVFLRPVLTYGLTAWIAADHRIYRQLQILERHALRIAYRIKLPSPTQELYNRITFPHLLLHLETLRTKYIQNRYETHHPLFYDILLSHEHSNTPPHHAYTPLSLLFTLYRQVIPPNHPDLAQIIDYTVDNIPHYIAPSSTAQWPFRTQGLICLHNRLELPLDEKNINHLS